MRRDTPPPMRRSTLRVIGAIVLVLALGVLSACGGDNLSLCDGCETATPTPTLTPTPTATPTGATPTATKTP